MAPTETAPTTSTSTTQRGPPSGDGLPPDRGHTRRWTSKDRRNPRLEMTECSMASAAAAQGLIQQTIEGDLEVRMPDVSSRGCGVRCVSDGRLVVAEPDSGAVLFFDPVIRGTAGVDRRIGQPERRGRRCLRQHLCGQNGRRDHPDHPGRGSVRACGPVSPC